MQDTQAEKEELQLRLQASQHELEKARSQINSNEESCEQIKAQHKAAIRASDQIKETLKASLMQDTQAENADLRQELESLKRAAPEINDLKHTNEELRVNNMVRFT